MTELRDIGPDCRESMVELLNNERVSRWLLQVPYPYTMKDADAFIEHCRQNEISPGDKLCAIYFDGVHAGGIGLHRRQEYSAELGYWVGEPFWNRGIATEAVRLILECGFEELKIQRIFALTFEGNLASEKVLVKNGFLYEGFLRKARFKHGKGINCKIFSNVI